MPITELLTRNATYFKDEVALVEINPEVKNVPHVTWREFSLIESNRDGAFRKQLTWGEFEVKANRFANLLLTRGVKKGDKVAILLMNCLDWLPIYFGILKTGALAVPLNFRYTAEEIAYCVDKADASVLVFGPEFIGRVEEVLPQMTKIKNCFYVGRECPALAAYRILLVAGARHLHHRRRRRRDLLFIGHNGLSQGYTARAPCAHALRKSRAGAPRTDPRRRFPLHSSAVPHRR